MYGIKRELKLNNKQSTYFAGCAGYSRFVYNYGLGLMMDSWGFEGVKAGDNKRLSVIKKTLTNLTKKRPEFAWMNQYSSRIYQNAFQNLGKAFARWRDPEIKAEMPQFKKKRHQCSFTVDASKGKMFVPAGKSIILPSMMKLGAFRLKEAIPYGCMSQTFTVSREAGKWFVSFMVDAYPLPAMAHTSQRVGIDLGIKTFAHLSDGTTIQTPLEMKKAKTKLSKLQWKNRNKVTGNRQLRRKTSNNGMKYFQRLRKQHFHIANAREDFLQKETTKLATTYQHIQIEDLNVKGMMANHKLAEAIGMLGIDRFGTMLDYKQKFHGFQLTKIDRWFPSSKTCHVCGHTQPMPLKERTYNCGDCGNSIDRDLNAAINIERWPSLPMAIGIRTAVDRKEPTPLVEAAIRQLNLFAWVCIGSIKQA